MDLDPRLLTALEVVVGVPAVLFGYIWLTEQVLRPIPDKRRATLRPWLWLAPALLFLIVFLIYPTIGTIIHSFQNSAGTKFVGLDNFVYFFTSPTTLVALKNNLLWVIVLTLLTVGFGMLIAVLVDRVRYESAAKAVIFLPLAISAVAASVIWTFMFLFKAPGEPQIGTINAAFGVVGLGPYPFLQIQDFSLNTLFLIGVMAWIWTGFCMVIISAALKGISVELLEAARVDGANEWQVFRGIVFPLLLPTLAVVATTIVITALKAFDIVYVMTGGSFDTQVMAQNMITQLFVNNQFGRGSAVAVVLLLTIIPVMALNIRRFQAQEAIR
jgi:alpha-glucoside transport system permease protein